MKRPGISGSTALLAALVIVSLVVSMGFGLFYLGQSSNVNRLQSKLTGDETEVSDLSSQLSSLQTQSSNQASQLQTIQSQLASVSQIQSSLQTLQSSVQSLQSQVQSGLSSSQTNANQIQQIQLTIQSINSTLKALQNKLTNLQPQVPLSTLVITKSSFNATANTENFVVQNTWNGTVNAQLQVYVMCINRAGAIFNCPNPVGTYTSNVIQFGPESVSTVSFNLAQVENLSSGTTDTLQVYLESAGTQVSPQYTLQYPT